MVATKAVNKRVGSKIISEQNRQNLLRKNFSFFWGGSDRILPTPPATLVRKIMSTTIEKTRPDDVLGNLTEDQQNIILDWCEELSYREVLKKIAAPPPEGLGLNVHYTSLRRFFLKRFPERFLRDRAASITHWEEIARQIEAPELGVFWVMAKEALEKHVFDRLQKEHVDQRDLTALLRLALRMEDQRLKWHAQFTAADRIHLDNRRFAAQSEHRQNIANLSTLVRSFHDAKTKPPQPNQPS